MTAPSAKVRILVVLSSNDRRGAEIQGAGLANDLQRRGFDSRVVALCHGSRPARLEIETLGPSALSIRTLRVLRRCARRVDIVIGYGSKTLPAGVVSLAGLSTTFIYRSIGDPAVWSRGGLHGVRTGWLFRRPAHVVALWDGAAESVRTLHRVPVDRVTAIPNARRSEDFPLVGHEERRHHRAQFGFSEDRTVVALVGSLTPEKRVGLAVESVLGTNRATLLIAGDGPERPEVDRLAEESGGDIRVLGALDDLRGVFAASDVVLSTSSTEGMPGVLIEAALCGIPAVATDVGASALVVGPGGLIVAADASREQIASGIEHVASNRATLADAARRHAAARFTWDAVAPRWVDLINSMMSVSGRRRAG